MQKERVDLHTHSSVSDGSDSPNVLVEKASKRGLKALALTDHDTTGGLELAEARAHELGIDFVRGVELSAHCVIGEIHLLGLFLTKEVSLVQKLDTMLSQLREKRDLRNLQILKKLQDLGIDIQAEEIYKSKKSSSIGRPHFATILMEKRVVSSYNEAFGKYLGKNGAAYVSKAKLDAKEAISFLRSIGAVTVLAHPMLNFTKASDLEQELPIFVESGLQAIEAYHTEHSILDTRIIVDFAAKYKLLLSGGSDYHGIHKAKVQLGVGKGSLYVPYYLYEKLKELSSS